VLGDLGQYLKTFETTLTVKRKTGVILTNGYAEESLAASETFRGCILPRYYFTSMDLGVHDKGNSILYVRLTQANCPDLSIEDIVTDGNGIEWKIIQEFDYESYGKVKLFEIQRISS